MDYHGNGKINYSEFLAATANLSSFVDDHKLKALFDMFDTDNSGSISSDNIHLAMQKLGLELPLEEVKAIIAKHDFDNDHTISFDEFKKIFTLEGDDQPKPF